jgi:hypothetical protein
VPIKKGRLLAFLWTGLIATSCLLPASVFREFTFDALLGLDKLIHFTLYIGLILLWTLSSEHLSNKNVYLLLVIAICYGILIEVLQASMALGRSYQWDDIIANTIGCILGVLLIPFFRKNMPLLKNYLPFLNKLY